MTYGEIHKFLLRSLASRGVMSLLEAQNVLANYTETEIPDISVEDAIKEINSKIRPFQQTIKLTNDEFTDEKVVIFLSLGFDEATKAQNIFSATELEYFRLLIERIMTTDSRQLTAIHAMNIVGQMKGSFTKTDAEKLLNTWCRMRYLDNDGDNYALGVRAIHEFEGYLRQNMPDTIEECCICKQCVFRGYNCPTCAKAIHTRCLNIYLEKVQKWPCCKEDFSLSQLEQLQNEVPANTSGETQQRRQSTSEPSTSRNSRLSQSQLTLPSPNREDAAHESEVSEEAEDTAMDTQDQELLNEVSQRITRKRKRQP